MNCNDLTISELARGQMMEASLRDQALVHAASCRNCAIRLADERALTEGLRGVVTEAAGSEAPLSVEAKLLAAFRAQHSENPAPVAVGKYSRRRWIYISAGAAAAAVIAMLFLLSGSGHRVSPPSVPEKADVSPQAVPPARRPELSPGTNGVPAIAEQAINTPPAHARRTAARIRNAGYTNRESNNATAPIADPEIATDFIPLMNRESLTQLDGGQVMRVELPRSALMSFGLPMDMERANERIKADVVVGNDGLARAIRFVR